MEMDNDALPSSLTEIQKGLRWLDTAEDPPVVKVWNGKEWEVELPEPGCFKMEEEGGCDVI
jgi:hypothetical protein